MRNIFTLLALSFSLVAFATNETGKSKDSSNKDAKVEKTTNEKTGKASWYGPGFHGKLTANGERYDMNGVSAAHKTLKFGTKVKITNLANGKSIVVRINDRGPYIAGRQFDLSKGAFKKIASIHTGVIKIKYEILK
ncbi:rlpA-like lipoprotein [Flavobacteriaceae bacterium UJ101]|nr:rlpA-like lipoprotein [Flavobacteriaceae bacterium UJ101]